jgi:integrase
MSRTNLKLRHNTWFCRLIVPTKLRPVVGKRELTQTLRTGDLRVAQQRRHAALAVMQATIDKAAKGDTRGAPTGILGTALALREEVRAGRIDARSADAALAAAVDRELDTWDRAHGRDEDGYPVMPESAVAAIRLAHGVVAGDTVTLLSEKIKAYMTESASHITAGTAHGKAKQLKAFTDWLERDMDVTAVTRAHARTYVSDVLLKSGAAPATIRKIVFTLSALWNWMELDGTVPENIWLKLSGKVKESKRGKVAVRRPWTDEEVLGILKGMPTGDVLQPLTALGAFTGMRIEEICSMRLEDVTENALKVREGKTAAAVRYVPLVPTVRPLVAQLVATSTDGFLLSGLLSGGVDNRRSHNVAKRFGRLTRSLGFTDEATVFHSLRASFAQKLERLGVPETTASLIDGHSRTGMSYGVYSKGVDEKALQAAVAGVSYGVEVDAIVRGLDTFTMSSQSRSRRRYKRVA